MSRKSEEYIKYIEKMKNKKILSKTNIPTYTSWYDLDTSTGIDVWNILDHIDISDIEKYLRMKKLKNIEKNND